MIKSPKTYNKEDGLSHVARLQLLTSLNLSGCNKITDKGVSELKVLTSLTSVNLDNCISFENLAFVPHLPNLSELSVSGCTKIGDDNLQVFKKRGESENAKMINIDISGCHRITQAGLLRLGPYCVIRARGEWTFVNVAPLSLEQCILPMRGVSRLTLKDCFVPPRQILIELASDTNIAKTLEHLTIEGRYGASPPRVTVPENENPKHPAAAMRSFSVVSHELDHQFFVSVTAIFPKLDRLE